MKTHQLSDTVASTPRGRTLFREFTAAATAELNKVASLRSQLGLYLGGVGFSLALAWLLGFSAHASGQNGFDSAMPAPLLVFATLQFGQLLFAAAAVLQITGEYSAQQMDRTLQAVPRRGLLLGAKALVGGLLGFTAGAVTVLVGTLPAALAAGGYGVFTPMDLVTASVGAGSYLGLLALMVHGLGYLCRNSAGAIVAMLMLVVGLPQILNLVAVDWIHELVLYLPSNAATFMATGASEPYGPVVALLVLAAWAIGLLGAGAGRLFRSDA